MKKQITFLLAMSIFLAFNGCNKNTLHPGEDENLHPVVWQYNYGQHQIHSDVIPAMDENGNIFFSILESVEGAKDVYVFANDKDGNALWDKKYSSADKIIISLVMYIDNKVIYVVRTYDALSDYQETIYCINALDGTENWQYSPDFKNEKLIEAMAVTSDYLIVGAKWGGDYPDIDELHYFNLQSGALVKSVDLGDDEVKNISIVSNDIYMGVMSTVTFNTNTYDAPKVIKMDIESNIILWSYTPEYEEEQDYIFENRSLPIDKNGRAFFVARKKFGNESSNIYIINNDGTLANTVMVPEKNAGSIFDILIDKDNNFYAATSGYFKYSPDGSQMWQFTTNTTVKNDNFLTGCVIGDNDTIYHAEDGGILNVNTAGEIAWAKYDETNFTKPGYPLLTNEGNMVVVGDLYLTCVKGDGAKIQDAPWPRVYQNNGNTSSR